MAALVALTTAFLKIPMPSGAGYIHIGDGAIYVAAVLLGPYAAAPAAVGSALADVIAGYPIYALPTLMIKGAMGYLAGWYMARGLCASCGKDVRKLLTSALVFAAAGLIMMAGYWVTDTVLFGWATALAGLPFNLLQGLGGVAIGITVCAMSGHIRKALGMPKDHI